MPEPSEIIEAEVKKPEEPVESSRAACRLLVGSQKPFAMQLKLQSRLKNMFIVFLLSLPSGRSGGTCCA